MTLLSAIRSKFGGQAPQQAFGEGRRFPLSKELTLDIRRHVAQLSGRDLAGYTVERRRSDYPMAKSDLVVYDPEGKAILDGREMQGGHSSFWLK